ncbi:2'-5' RNA ligase family protein [Streptodolium elevatio]|uniref:2'-5' RNA ligase family protein n=1 Tax=Streptodolium elevatio TaxID=3157996 RepID=A0ABV3D8S8_9ACTN
MAYPPTSPTPASSPHPALPPSLTDADAIATSDWEAFSSIRSMVNHWDRPGWTPGRRSYHWFLTFPDAPDLASTAAELQAELAHFRLDVIPADGLHITMAKLGFTDEVTDEHLSTAIGATERACAAIGAFDLRVIPLAGSPGAVRFSVAPWAPLTAIRDALPTAPSGSAFRPHLGIAYSNRTMPAKPVIDAVAALRSRESVSLPVGELHLVELRREHRTYRWDLVKSFLLGTSTH